MDSVSFIMPIDSKSLQKVLVHFSGICLELNRPVPETDQIRIQEAGNNLTVLTIDTENPESYFLSLIRTL